MAPLPRPPRGYDALAIKNLVQPSPDVRTPVAPSDPPQKKPELRATKRPLFDERNGAPFTITATSPATAHTIFTAGAINEGWDEPTIYLSNSTGNGATVFYDIGGTGTWSRTTVNAGTFMVALIPIDRDRLVFRGGISIKAYANGAGIQITGAVLEVRVDG